MGERRKIIIWGTGFKAVHLYHYLDLSQVGVVGFTDNSGQAEMVENFLFTHPYLPVDSALNSDFDFIVIASNAYCEITNQLLCYGIGREQIVQAYNTQFMIPDSLYYFNDLETDEEKYKIFKSLSCFADRSA